MSDNVLSAVVDSVANEAQVMHVNWVGDADCLSLSDFFVTADAASFSEQRRPRHWY